MTWQRIDSVDELPRKDLVLAEYDDRHREQGWPPSLSHCRWDEELEQYYFDDWHESESELRDESDFTHFMVSEGLE